MSYIIRAIYSIIDSNGFIIFFFKKMIVCKINAGTILYLSLPERQLCIFSSSPELQLAVKKSGRACLQSVLLLLLLF